MRGLVRAFAVAWILAGVLLAPGAWAEGAQGEFVLDGYMDLPPETRVEADPIFVYSEGTGALVEFTLHAQRARVRYFESPSMSVEDGAVALSMEKLGEDFLVKDAVFEYTGLPEDGFLMLRVDLGQFNWTASRATLAIKKTTPISLRPSAGNAIKSPVFGDAVHVGGAHEWEPPFLPDDYLVMGGAGSIGYTGSGLIAVSGPDFLLKSDAMNRELPTGSQAEGGTAGIQRYRWLVIEFREANLTMNTASTWVAAAPQFSLAWKGVVRFSPVRGALETERARLHPISDHVRMDGQFQGFATTIPASGDYLALLSMQGELDWTENLRSETLAASGTRNTPSSWGILFGAFAVLAGGGVAWRHVRAIRRRRARPSPRRSVLPGLSPEDCVAVAARAADEARWGLAAEWLERATLLAPTSGRAWADLAYVRLQMGDPGEAFRLFEKALGLGADDPDAHFHAAVAAARVGRPPAEVSQRLASALEAAPSLVLDAEEAPEFGPLHGRPAFEEARAKAWTRLEGRAEGSAGAGSP